MAVLKQVLILLSYFLSSLKCDSLESIEHIVIFMQENRAFDHYYGAMKGVRGFNDRAAPLLPTGRSPFYQPVNGSFDDDAYMLPYYLSFNKTSATCMSAPTMAYYNDILMFDGGKMDAWNTARSPGFGMSHFNRTDLPFYYALGDNYLVGDNYYQSTFTATNPNRLHLFSGSNGLSVNSSYCILDDSEPSHGINWITMGEILQDAGITWRVYQEQDNFDDNGFAWFDQYKAAKPGTPLYDNGMYRSNNLYDEFANDVRNGSLPQVSWIVGPANLSEHARYHPQDGEDLSARLIKIFGEKGNEEIYKKTVFILNYDEGGQFYDHLWVPTAPMNQPMDGQSTVSTEGEVTVKTEFNIPPGNPIGPGFRVPFFIISPWTRADGGVVFSQLTDHTSTIKFIEKRFGVYNPNISPWRRAVMSDLLYAFDFDNPDYTFPTNLPDTSQNTEQSAYQCDHNPDPKLPSAQSMPTQEAGTKISRALPYKFDIEDTVDNKKNVLTLNMSNIGASDGPACVFHVHDYLNTSNIVKKFTIEVGKSITDTWDINKDGAYNISLHGPNGYVRGFSAAAAQDSGYSVRMTESDESVLFMIECVSGSCSHDLIIEDMAYGNPLQIEGQIMDRLIKKDVSGSGNWYDYRIREVDADGVVVMERRFMGRLETGKDTITDPAMAIPRIDENIDQHPDMKFYFDAFIENERARKVKKADEFVCNDRKYIKNHGFVKDVCWLQEHQ